MGTIIVAVSWLPSLPYLPSIPKSERKHYPNRECSRQRSTLWREHIFITGIVLVSEWLLSTTALKFNESFFTLFLSIFFKLKRFFSFLVRILFNLVLHPSFSIPCMFVLTFVHCNWLLFLETVSCHSFFKPNVKLGKFDFVCFMYTVAEQLNSAVMFYCITICCSLGCHCSSLKSILK